jgi:hypothetical protein
VPPQVRARSALRTLGICLCRTTQVGLLSTTLHLPHGPLFAGFAVFSTVFCALLLAAWRLVQHRHPHPHGSVREEVLADSAQLTRPLLGDEPRTGGSEQVPHDLGALPSTTVVCMPLLALRTLR